MATSPSDSPPDSDMERERSIDRLDRMAPGVATVGIRPDAITLQPRDGGLALPVTVALVEPIGAESHVHLRWRDRLLVAQVHGRPELADGAELTAYADLAAVHPFDAGGNRIGG